MKYPVLAFCCFFSLASFGQFSRSLIEAKLNLPAKKNISETIVEMGESFLGNPYKGGTLEGPEEKLVCRIDAFDCYTFVENVLALSLAKQSNAKSYDNYLKILQSLRYRNGKIEGYSSRIHYFSEWAKLAENRHILQDITPLIGTKNPKTINFMSSNRRLYPSFAMNDVVFADIVKMENGLKKYTFFEVKKEELKNYLSLIKNGDIIAFTSKTPGLDVNHEGFAVWKSGQLYLMHASAEQHKVVISEETLMTYLNRIKKHNGVMILRVNQPKN